MRIFITGCAGFIGYHLSKKLLLNKSIKIHGIDNLNNYYDVKIKKDRLKLLKENNKFAFTKIDLVDKKKLSKVLSVFKPDIIINLAAQAGVRFSIKNPEEYTKSNILGFINILDLAKDLKVKHFLYASTSSVYGETKKFPNDEEHDTSKPLSYYAATKKCNEIISYSYSNIYKLPTTGLRFFTVYGPYGRPDMSLYKFCKNIIENKKIELFNNGNHFRDFTFIDDLVNMITKIIDKPSKKKIPYEIFNLASSKPVNLMFFLKCIQDELGKDAKIIKMPKQLGDVLKTHGSIKKYNNNFVINNKTSIKKGVKSFVKWYKSYYRI